MHRRTTSLFCGTLHFDYHRLEHLYKVYYVCTPDEENHIDAGGLPLVRYNPHVISLSRRKNSEVFAIFSSFYPFRMRILWCLATA